MVILRGIPILREREENEKSPFYDTRKADGTLILAVHDSIHARVIDPILAVHESMHARVIGVILVVYVSLHVRVIDSILAVYDSMHARVIVFGRSKV